MRGVVDRMGSESGGHDAMGLTDGVGGDCEGGNGADDDDVDD